MDGVEGFVHRHGDDDALAGSEAVGLDDDWSALFLNVGAGLIGIGEDFVFGRRDAVFLHEVLRERLRALDFSGALRRAEGLDAGRVHRIDNTIRQRHFRTDDDEVDVFFFGELDEIVVIRDGNAFDALGDVLHARIARYGIELRGFWRLREFPGQRVLTSARTDY